MSDEIRIIDDAFPPDVHERLSLWASNRSIEAGAIRLDGRDRRGFPALASNLRQRLGRWILGDPAKGSPADRPGGREHWRRRLLAADAHNLADVADLLATDRTLEPVDAAWKSISASHLTDSILIGCQIEGCGPGIDGCFQAEPASVGEQTVIVFLNRHWTPDWAGETVLLGEADDIVSSVLPRPNRVVFFPANLRHAQRRVSDLCPDLRKTLVWRTRRRRAGGLETLSSFLREHGAMDCSHYVGTLHDHLVRTFIALEKRGCQPEVCLGGGLHSVYGTSLLDHQMLTHSDRGLVAQRFGSEAEKLAYLFSILDRPGTLATPLALDDQTAVVELRDGQRLDLSRRDLDDLRMIDCANLEDQDTLKDYPPLMKIWNEFSPRSGSYRRDAPPDRAAS